MSSYRKPGPIGLEIVLLDPDRGLTSLSHPMKPGVLGLNPTPSLLPSFPLRQPLQAHPDVANPKVDPEQVQLAELREGLRIALNQMVTEIASRSKLLEKELQAQQLLQQNIILTGAFLSGLYEAGKSVVQLASDAMVAMDNASDQLKRALIHAIRTQSTEQLQQGFRRIQQEAAQAQQTIEEVSERIALLHDDEQTWQLLSDFPERYWSHLHATEKAKLAGSLSFDILLAFFTLGVGVAASVLSKSRYFKKVIDALRGILKILEEKKFKRNKSIDGQSSAGSGAAKTPSEAMEKAGVGKSKAVPSGAGKESKKVGEGEKFVPEKFSDMYAKVPAAKLEIDAMADEIANLFGGRVAKAPIKSQERAIQKIINDYGGDATRIKDLARNTIIVSPDKMNRVVAELAKRGANVKEINGSVDPLGYSGVNSTIKTQAGIFGEIQVNTPAMIYAKEPEPMARLLLGDDLYASIAKKSGIPGGQGHKFYEQWRGLSPSSSQAQSIADQSRNYYDVIRRENGY